MLYYSWEIVPNIYYSDAKEGRPCSAVAKGFVQLVGVTLSACIIELEKSHLC